MGVVMRLVLAGVVAHRGDGRSSAARFMGAMVAARGRIIARHAVPFRSRRAPPGARPGSFIWSRQPAHAGAGLFGRPAALLVLGTLSFWLREAGVDRTTIGYLSWVGLAYAFKWVWSPLVDRCRCRC
jgi:hypothetical protein